MFITGEAEVSKIKLEVVLETVWLLQVELVSMVESVPSATVESVVVDSVIIMLVVMASDISSVEPIMTCYINRHRLFW